MTSVPNTNNQSATPIGFDYNACLDFASMFDNTCTDFTKPIDMKTHKGETLNCKGSNKCVGGSGTSSTCSFTRKFCVSC